MTVWQVEEAGMKVVEAELALTEARLKLETTKRTRLEKEAIYRGYV